MTNSSSKPAARSHHSTRVADHAREAELLQHERDFLDMAKKALELLGLALRTADEARAERLRLTAAR